MTNQQFQTLVEKYLAGEASAEEKQLIDTYLEKLGKEEAGIITEDEVRQSTASILEKLHAEMRQDQDSHPEPISIRRSSFNRRTLRYAAAVLIIAGCAILYGRLTSKQQPDQVVRTTSATPVNDALPGSNKAVLTLASGSHITLDQDENQTIKEQNGQQIANINGSLSYTAAGTPASAASSPANSAPEVFYNTVRVPRKGQYKLVLADGTKVWLNAESSLKYPTSFAGPERRVQVLGEAYFEVAKDASRPFHVEHNNMDIEVLGTHFNVNSYDDERQSKVTLLEGAVNVSSSISNTAVKLTPGQQARIRPEGKLSVIDNVDTDEAIAWKEGRFQFRAATLESIMRQITRWYDVEVEYRGDFSHRHFTADISRSKNLSSVIKILELSNITCTIEDHKLIVTP